MPWMPLIGICFTIAFLPGGRTHDLAGVDLRHDHQKLADLAGGIGGNLSGRDRQRLVEVAADPENGFPDASL